MNLRKSLIPALVQRTAGVYSIRSVSDGREERVYTIGRVKDALTLFSGSVYMVWGITRFYENFWADDAHLYTRSTKSFIFWNDVSFRLLVFSSPRWDGVPSRVYLF